MHIDELIARLGTELGIPDLALNSENVCRLVLNDSISIDLEWQDELETLHVHCCLGEMPHEGTDAWMQLMLSANLYGRRTGGAAIAYDPDLGEIVLCRHAALRSFNFLQFVDDLEQFGQAALYWTERLQQRIGLETSDTFELSGHGLHA